MVLLLSDLIRFFFLSLSNKQHWDSKGRFYIKTSSEVLDSQIFFSDAETNFSDCSFETFEKTCEQIRSLRLLLVHVKIESLCEPN